MMKNILRSLAFKIICFILCGASVILAALSAVGVYMLNEYTAEGQSAEEVFSEKIENKLYYDAQRLLYVARAQNGHFSTYPFDVEFAPNATNLRFDLYQIDEKGVATEYISNRKDDPFTAEKWQYSFFYNEINGNISEVPADSMRTSTGFQIMMYLEEGLPLPDSYASIWEPISFTHQLNSNVVYVTLGVSVVIAIAAFVILMCISGRRPTTEGIHCGPLNCIPSDILAVITALPIALAIFCAERFIHNEERMVAEGVILCVAAFLVIGLCMSIAARWKEKSLFTNTVTWRCLKLAWKAMKWVGRLIKRFGKWIWRIFLMIPMVWRTAAVVLINGFIDFIFIVSDKAIFDTAIFILFRISKGLLLSIAVIYIAVCIKRLKQAGEALANGDLDYQINTEKMLWDLKNHGDNLNRIGEGMTIAVEERLKSERTKAELITNVSHDIKTPLTSIINYARLITEEECDSDKHKEYSEVLVRKSEHLKHLLEDIVEISKATTGNLEVDLRRSDACVLLAQASGEFQQKCAEAKLELITSYPEESIWIMADSRRIWRVFENLMNNACKYSLPGSRVYLSLEKKDGEARFIFRNTSKTALNISPEELMERFVRGDVSRTTEGNGLGLSIARSLTELQNGNMDIAIDGDLFKVILTFPTV